jgi:nucleoside-diphosphate-sugar epimerase
MDAMPHLLVFGYGYTARHLGALLKREGGWRITGTRRSRGGLREMAQEPAADGFTLTGLLFDGQRPPGDHELEAALNAASHVLVTAAPDRDGDAVLRHTQAAIRRARPYEWIGYLSTSGVYGDQGGDWVDESTPPAPGLPRTRRRLEAEEGWRSLGEAIGVPVQIFRLPGIYGPARSVVDRLRAGTARHIVDPAPIFNRAHVKDIAGAVRAGMDHPEVTGPVNVCDDLPTLLSEPLLYAAERMGLEPPAPMTLDEAGLGPVGRSFFAESRRLRNRRMKEELGYRLHYPTYCEGLDAILAKE